MVSETFVPERDGKNPRLFMAVWLYFMWQSMIRLLILFRSPSSQPHLLK